VKLPSSFLSDQLLNPGMLNNESFTPYKELFVNHPFPEGNVVFYSLLLDALMLVSVNQFEELELQLLGSDIFNKQEGLKAQLNLKNCPVFQNYAHPDLAKHVLLELLLSLGSTILYCRSHESLVNQNPLIVSQLHIKAFQNTRLQKVLFPFFQENLIEICDNPEAAIAYSTDPLAAWLELLEDDLSAKTRREFSQLISHSNNIC
jgi:hypothetical protein